MTSTNGVRPSQNYEVLRKELLRSGALYADNHFPPTKQSIYGGNHYHTPNHLTDVYNGHIIWKRPTDMYKNPVFVANQASRHDLDQGCLGNCWFIAGAAVLATSYRKCFKRAVPLDQGFEDGEYTGMFRFNFWWYGKWKEVVVDDYLPTDGYNLLYCKNKERPNEFWPCLLEKAYAKLRGSYENLVGGKIQDAMVDLTGGISEVLDIRDKRNVSPELYSLLYKSHTMKTMMGACIFRPNDATEREVKRSDGLYMGHAYSITGYRQINTGRAVVNLLRLRNPWGRREWNGPWSDGSREMTLLSKDLQEDLMFRNRDEGEFWMSYPDFLQCFDEIQLCHLQPDSYISELTDNDKRQNWIVTVYHDAWLQGITAGGCGNYPHESLYWQNPQFFVKLESPDSTLGHGDDCTLIVSLMEKEQNNKSQIAVGFDIYKLRDPEFKPLNDVRAPRNALRLTNRSGKYQYYREVTKRFELPPGNYVIIPCTFNPHEESEFMLRLFTEKHAKSGVLDEEVIVPQPSTISVGKDALVQVFERHAGSDNRMDAVELSAFLKDMSILDLREELKFPVEACRSLIILMDRNKSGLLSVSEVKKAFGEIKAYREVFKRFDKDHSNTIDTSELSKVFSTLGFSLTDGLLMSIVRRYAGRNNRISLTDFVMAICRLTTLFASFQEEHGRQSGGRADVAEFTRNEFLQIAMTI